MSETAVLEIPCIGQSFQLGMLYDCRRDRLIPDVTLWNGDILSNGLASRHVPQSQHKIFTNDSLDDKMEMVGANANFRLSLLSGLVEVPNYASFFKDRVSIKQQARVTLKYESVSTFEELDVNLLGRIPHEENEEQKNATHFISGITYGSNTFFVFDREVKRNESRVTVAEDMKLLISSLPNVSNRDTGLLGNAKDMTCTVYGDNPLSGSTMSFEEGLKTFEEVSKNHGTVVPIIARLQPLSSLEIEAARFSNVINVDTISQVLNIMENFSDLNIRLDVVSKNTAFSNFSSIQEKFYKFREMISQYQNTLQKNLSHLLTKVRSGDADEEELVIMLKEIAATPFTQTYLSSWVDKAEKEVKLLSTYLDYFKGIQFAFQPDELETVIHSLDYDRVVCFSFMIPNFQDKQLEEMHTYLRTGKWSENLPDERIWYENPAIIKDFKSQARRFSTFAKTSANDNNTKFVVTNVFNECNDDKVAFIQTFQDGQPTELEAGEFPPQSSPVGAHVNDVGSAIKSGPKASASTRTVFDSETTIKETSFKTPTVPRESQKFTGPEAQIEERHQVVPESSSKNDVMTDESHSDVKFGGTAFDEKGKKKKKKRKKKGKSNLVDPGDASPSALYDEKIPVAGGHEFPTPDTGGTKMQAGSSTFRLAEQIRLQSEEIESGNNSGSVSIYKIPTIETMRNDEKKLVKKCLKYPQERANETTGGRPQEKVLMVMGATGAGKSTLINGMVNYILGVEWQDKFRFKLVDETVSSQAHSVTKEITAYTIHPVEGSALPYTFTIIDTPGYGDTEGLTRDLFITGQIKEFFSLMPPVGIDHLDGIGFVTQSSLARLTPTQKYIFDAILSIFGKNMENNIFMMVTFADGQHPPVLTAINKAQISYRTFFKFNNSALFAANTSSGFDQMFWQMGVASFDEFFCQFQSVESVNLEQTNQVLSERERLEVLVEGLNPQIKEGLAKLEEMRREKLVILKHETEMEHNKDFNFMVDVMKTKKTDLQGTGRNTTTCLGCNFTCHKDCAIADNSEKKGCVAMGVDGNCEVCSGNCYWERHKNVPYLIEHEIVKEKRTSEDLKKKYNMAASGKIRVEGIIKELERQYYELRLKVITQMYDVRMCLQRLDEIALKPNPLTEVEYIELLIETEKQEGQPGFMDRVKALEEVKSTAAMFSKIKSTDEIPQLLEEVLPKEDVNCGTSGPRQEQSYSRTGLKCVIQ